MSSGVSVDLSVILPAYNERDNIGPVLDEAVPVLEGLGLAWEILVIDNHSADGTPEVVRRYAAAEPRIRLIVHDRNRLYSGSCQTGMRASLGRYVAIMNSDCQYTAADLPRFLEAVRGGANLVFGWRRRRRDPWPRKVVSWVFNRLARLRLGVRLHDLNVGLCMFDRAFLEDAPIRHSINMANPELWVRARQRHLAVGEIEVRHFHRRAGRSSHNFLRLFGLFRQVDAYFAALARELAGEEAA
jgi:glycosyltransferase involved in cell wall biosynthesis